MAKVKQPKVEMWAVDRLIPYDKNAKIHTETQIESLAKVIKSQGWDVPIVVDKDGVIIKGHGRRLAAIHMGLKEVPVICRTDLTPAQVRAARLSDNRVALTDFDTTMIREEIAALNTEGFDVSLMGFDTKEIDMMIKDLDSVDTGAFEVPDQPEEKPAEQPKAPEGEKPKPPVEFQEILGFKGVPQEYERDMIKFLSYAESMTGKKGAVAFAEFCQSVVSEIEARS